MKNDKEILFDISICDKLIRLVRLNFIADEYSGSQSGAQSLQAWLIDNSRSKKIYSLDELRSLIEECDLTTIIQENKSNFSILFSIFFDKGRVITSIPLYDFLEKDYPIRIEECMPNIQGDRLLFTTVATVDIGKFKIFRFEVNTKDLDYRVTEIKEANL